MKQHADENYLELDEVMADGYGIVSRKVMRADFISPKAKTLYAYLCSFAGSGDTAFPSTDTIRQELQLAKDTFYKTRKELEAFGIIEVNTYRTRDGAKTIYRLLTNAKITPDAKALVDASQNARKAKVNNLPNSTDSKKKTSSNEKDSILIRDTPQGFKSLEEKSLKRVHADELEETIEAYNKAIHLGYTPKEIEKAYESYCERYRREHPETIRYAKRLKNYLLDSDGLAFDAGRPSSIKQAIIKQSPETLAKMKREKAEEIARVELEKSDEEYIALSKELIDLATEKFKCAPLTDKERNSQIEQRMKEIERLMQLKVSQYINNQFERA